MAKKKSQERSMDEQQSSEELLKLVFQAYATANKKSVEELSDDDRAEALAIAATGELEIIGPEDQIEALKHLLAAVPAESDADEAIDQDLAAGADLSAYFEEGSWAGHAQHKCKLCPWDTLDGEMAMIEHILQVHTPEKPLAPKIPVANASGKQIN